MFPFDNVIMIYILYILCAFVKVRATFNLNLQKFADRRIKGWLKVECHIQNNAKTTKGIM